jgi:hypothetical protein
LTDLAFVTPRFHVVQVRAHENLEKQDAS